MAVGSYHSVARTERDCLGAIRVTDATTNSLQLESYLKIAHVAYLDSLFRPLLQ